MPFMRGGDVAMHRAALEGCSSSCHQRGMARCSAHAVISVRSRRIGVSADFWGYGEIRPQGMRYLSGGPLGNAILLAMTTATWKWETRCREAKNP
jgi:hypothetical protein